MDGIWRSLVTTILLLACATPAGAAPQPERREPLTAALHPPQPRKVILDRSLLVREPALLGAVSFGAVMQQLAASAGIDDGKALFRQWWSTLGEGPDEAVAAGLACPAPGSERRLPTLNAFPMLCDPDLAGIASMPDPLGEAGAGPFLIIGAVNRVDLMPKDPHPRDCGEFRLIAAYDPDWPDWPEYRPNERMQIFVNFEAVIPNPAGDPRLCRAIQRFWASLSGAVGTPTSDSDLAEALRRFFLVGGELTEDGRLLDPGAPGEHAFTLLPAISAANLGSDEIHRRGQVRTNTRTANGWVLRQFAFRDFGGVPRLVPVPTDGSPDASLFEENAAGARELAQLIQAESDLLAPNINAFSFMPEPTGVEATQWIIPLQGMPETRFSYGEILGNEPRAVDPVRDSIKALAAASPGYRSPSIIKRLEVLSCAGCHRFVRGAKAEFVDDDGRPVKWPPSIRFTHILPELDDTGRYRISDALACVLLPHRERRLRLVLDPAADPTPPEDPAASERCRQYFE